MAKVPGDIKISAADVAKKMTVGVTVTLTGVRMFSARFKLGMFLIGLGTRITGMRTEVKVVSPTEGVCYY